MGAVPVIENGLPVQCGVCRLNMWWTKKRGKTPSAKACGCTPEPEEKPAFGSVTLKARESTSKKGGRGEKRTVKMMTGADLLAKQTAGSGATGSRNCEKAFDTDITAQVGDTKFTLEVKTMETVPGLHSMRKLKGRSHMLRVEDGEGGAWFMDDDVARQVLGIAAVEAGVRL